MKVRRYSEMRRFETFEERFDYLRLAGEVGASTFGFDRYINQDFYRSQEWRSARRDVIVRDNGCDLGIPGREIHTGILVHHINPMTVDDVVHGEDWIINPEFLVTTCQLTHNAIHFGDSSNLRKDWTPREPGDTKLW